MARISIVALSFKGILFFVILMGASVLLGSAMTILSAPIIGIVLFLEFKYNFICITDNKIEIKTGFLFKKSKEIFKNKIESVEIDQTLLGEILNFGDISIQGTGSNRIALKSISDPKKFKDLLENSVN